MRNKRRITLSKIILRLFSWLVLMLMSLGWMSDSIAYANANDEMGHFSMMRSYTQHDDNTVTHPNGSEVTTSTLKGTTTIFQSSGPPFTDRENALVTCLIHMVKTESSDINFQACTSINNSGDQLYTLLSQKNNEDTDTDSEGYFELVGGTGKYEGVKGACTYQTTYLETINSETSKEAHFEISEKADFETTETTDFSPNHQTVTIFESAHSQTTDFGISETTSFFPINQVVTMANCKWFRKSPCHNNCEEKPRQQKTNSLPTLRRATIPIKPSGQSPPNPSYYNIPTSSSRNDVSVPDAPRPRGKVPGPYVHMRKSGLP